MQKFAVPAGIFRGIDPQSSQFTGLVAVGFYYALGCGPNTLVEVAAENPHQELQKTVRQAQIENPQQAPQAGPDPPPQTYRAASVAEKGTMRLALKRCLMKRSKEMTPAVERDLRQQFAS